MSSSSKALELSSDCLMEEVKPTILEKLTLKSALYRENCQNLNCFDYQRQDSKTEKTDNSDGKSLASAKFSIEIFIEKIKAEVMQRGV